MDPKLPLKKVTITGDNFFAPAGGGGEKTVFGDVTADVRRRVVNELKAVGTHFAQSFRTNPSVAGVARVILKPESLAKSHRPTPLFESGGCPIVGIGGLGELLVSVRSSTIPRLASAIERDTTKVGVANISTIQSVEPFALSLEPLEELKARLADTHDLAVKLRVFRHHDTKLDDALSRALLKELAELKVKVTALAYARGLSICRLVGLRAEHVDRVANFVGTQSLGAFPDYHVVRPAAHPISKLTVAQLPAPEPGVSYPTVGVIDTGIDPSNALLAPWVVGREVFVPKAEHDYEHGTFVAGLLVHARTLNHNDQRFPNCPCRVLDILAIPGSQRVSEDELLAILWEVLPKYPNIRVWNLSLGGSEPCSDHAFSDLAIALDELQVKYKVTFVLPTGNYVKRPYRDWPPTIDLGEDDRMCGPADSICALTVGSVAHRESPSSRVRSSKPSPFSRRGPGPAYLPKPEVAHFGGNVDATGGHAQMGVLSVDGHGNLAEAVGTGFAGPVAAALLAYVEATPIERMSMRMAKALVIHSAVLAGRTLTADDLRYCGFGIPDDARDILGCDPWSVTLLFETEIRAGRDLHRWPFPLPGSLRTDAGALRGEMTATLVYGAPLDANYGAEYCRSHLDVSLGTYLESDSGDREHKRQVHPFPVYPNSGAFEKSLVEHGFKWSPVKVYRRSMPKGVSGDMWRLALMATDRSGAENATVPVALVVTISDPDKNAPVYNEVVAEMNRLGWITNDVSVRERARVRR